MATFEIVPMDSGYVLRPFLRPQKRILLGQFLSYLVGVSLAITAIGTFVLPVIMLEGALTSLRIGVAGLLGAAAVYLLWFASRGSRAEVQIDFETQTVRTLIPHRCGAPTLLEDYPFSVFSGVFRQPTDVPGQSTLTLQTKDGGTALWLARAETAKIAALQARLERDLFVRL